ncbi:MAG TPA: copper transporter [Solirubrobacteraceae bacterium]|nr:copper transporter [Solirubrobacteraceae bacterium]
MFDFRYHAVSLAAVLIALAVGLLLGVAIGDANLVSNAEKHIENSLRGEINQARGDAAQVRAQLGFRAQYESAVYPRLVAGRLRGKRIGMIFLGQPSNQLSDLARAALGPTGAQIVLVAVIRDPVDASALANEAAGTRYAALAGDPGLLGEFGVRMGVQLVAGGRLLGRVQRALFSSYNGAIERLGGVVLVRAPGAVDPAVQKGNDQFENGLASGLGASGVPVVGVETSATSPSQIPWYTDKSFASVDDLDDIAGSTALVDALAGARGAFGRKPTATAVLPPSAGNGHP